LYVLKNVFWAQQILGRTQNLLDIAPDAYNVILREKKPD